MRQSTAGYLIRVVNRWGARNRTSDDAATTISDETTGRTALDTGFGLGSKGVGTDGDVLDDDVDGGAGGFLILDVS